MGAMTVDEIYKDRKKFSNKVFDIASTDLFNMGIQVRNIFRPKTRQFLHYLGMISFITAKKFLMSRT